MARGPRPLRLSPATDGAHGHVAALPDPRDGGRRRLRGADDRSALRHQHAGSGRGRSPHALGAGAAPGAPGRGDGRRGGQRRRGAGRPRPRARAGARRRTRRGPTHRRRGRRSERSVLLVAGALRRGRLLRALPRDPLVPAARRDHALHRVHLRHAAGHLPLRLRGGLPARRAVGASPRPAAAGLPALPVRPARVLGPGRPRPRGPAPDDARPRVVPRVLAKRGCLPPGRHVGPRSRRPAVRRVAPRSLRAPDRPHGAVVPGPPAGGPGRPRDVRAQGRPPAGGQHRGLCRGQPRGGPRRAHLARDEWLAAPPAGRRGRLRRSGPAGVRCEEPLRAPRRAPPPGGRRAARARSALAASARGVVVAGDGGRGRHQRRGDPAVDRRVARGGQRQAPQPASLRRRPHAARGDPGARPSRRR